MATRARSFGSQARSKGPCLKHRDHMPAAIRSTGQWKKVRELKRKMSPLCEDPFGVHAKDGVTVAASEVHHKQTLKDRPDLAFDLENLMSICSACHGRVEDWPKGVPY